ncbi:MAG: flagellin [Lachnospiraceae bacterium]|nr:flagellin [Lachnospiraceae bacterium]
MRVNSISNSNKDIYNIYSKLSSGKRINKAADDAAGLAIAKKMQRQENGLLVSAQNAKDGMGVLNVADGAMGGMMDYLQRIRELALRASNGIYSDSDRETFQTEIDSLKEGIQSLAKDTSLNEQTLLDGSMADMHLATNPKGGGLNISMANTTLEALGIADFDVRSGNFDLSVIDKAMDKISGARSNAGAYTNRLTYTYNYNLGAAEETTRSRSSIEDLDLPVAISEKKKKDILMQYRNMMLRNTMNQRSSVRMLFR